MADIHEANSEKKEEPEKLKDNINSLRKSLAMLGEQKENWFKKKEELKQKIAELIRRIRGIKEKSDNNTKEVAELKRKRDETNKKVQELIPRIRELNKERGIRFGQADPLEIKRIIKGLEEQIETQVLSLEKEKGIMKRIKEMRKQLKELGDGDGIIAKITTVSNEISKAKSEAEDFHNRLKEALNLNKWAYKEFKQVSEDITQMKREQEQAFANFVKFKQEYQNKNSQLKAGLGIFTKAVKEKREKKREERKEKEKAADIRLKEKAEDVERKIKEKRTLTTEDLLVIQGQKY